MSSCRLAHVGRFRRSTELYASPRTSATFQHALRVQERQYAGLQAWLIAEAGEPLDPGFFAKPSDLAFGVAPCGLLNRLARFWQRQFAAQDEAQFTIADEVQRLGGFVQTALQQFSYFAHPSLFQHRSGPHMNPLVQVFARRHQPNFHNAPAFKRLAAFAMD